VEVPKLLKQTQIESVSHLYYTRSASARCILEGEVCGKKKLNKTYGKRI